MGPEKGYIDGLDQQTRIQIRIDASISKSKLPLRASSAGACRRQLTFQLMQYLGRETYPSEFFEPSVHRLLNLGSLIEAHVIQQFESLHRDYQVKHKQQNVSLWQIRSTVDPSLVFEVGGSIDFVLSGSGHSCVVDVKSKKDWSVGKFKTHWKATSEKLKAMSSSVQVLSDQAFWVEDLTAFLAELKDPFFEANFLQLNVYALSEFIQSLGVDHAMVLQYNKNTSEFREIRFKPSLELFQKVRSKFQSVVDAVVQGGPAFIPRGYEKGSVVCRYCRFTQTCNLIPGESSPGKNKGAICGI
jgi:hypothetical protein